jgi:oligopeptide transport system substrate-binding protein
LKKLLYIIVASILILALLSGCDIIFPTTTTRTVTPQQGVLNLFSVDPTTLDPAVTGDATSSEYILQIFSGLLTLDDKMEPSPDIASSWDMSADGLIYTFHLRNDVSFHDGTAVKAQDFKYSMERVADPKTMSQTAETYLGDIVGIKDMLAGKAKTANGIKVIDDYTLQLTIDSPKSYFLYKLTYPTSFVVDKKNVSSGPNWWKEPNGTGPFSLLDWTENESLTLERNELYYGQKASLEEVQYQFYSGMPMDLYETGEIDVTGVSTSYIDSVMDKAGPFYNDLKINTAMSFYYIGFNCSQPPFDDVNVRKAFRMAIDKDKMISLIYRDMVQKADGVLPPGIPGYNKNLTGISFDPAKAKELIKNSKYGDVSKLPVITLTTSGYGGGASSTLQAMVYQWKQNLGVDVHIRQMEPEIYYYNLKNERDQMFEMGWNADYPHPQDFIDILFSSNVANNYGGFSNTQVDTLISQANRELDSAKSFALYQQAEQKIIDDAACIPLTFDKDYLLVKPYVTGYSPNPLGFVALNEVKVSSQ